MHVELNCRNCECVFTPEEIGAENTLWERLSAEGPWSALGDGETVEDHIIAQLSPGEEITCPNCAAIIEMDAETLGELSRQLLEQW
jgi:hypothetical protein